MHEAYFSSEPASVAVATLDGLSHVWLRANARKDTADNGPDGQATEFWVADEIELDMPGPVTVSEVEAKFDALWEAHRRDGMSAEERMAEVEAAQALAASSMASVEAMGKIVVPTLDVTDAQAVGLKEFYPRWEDLLSAGATVEKGKYLVQDGELYRPNQTVTAQAHYQPKDTPTIYVHVNLAGDGLLVWDKDAIMYDTNIYNTGVKVHYPDAQGAVYVSKRDGNTSVPGADRWWELVE